MQSSCIIDCPTAPEHAKWMKRPSFPRGPRRHLTWKAHTFVITHRRRLDRAEACARGGLVGGGEVANTGYMVFRLGARCFPVYAYGTVIVIPG